MGAALPILSIGATVAGGIFSAVGAYNQNEAAANAASYNAAVAQNAATYARQAGEVQAQAADRQTAALIGRQKAGFAASGIDVNTGSPLDIQSDTARFGRLNDLTIRNNAARQAWGYQATGNLETAQAQNYQTAATTSAIGSLIGTGGSVANKWQSFQTAGVDPFAVSAFGGGGSNPLIGGGPGNF